MCYLSLPIIPQRCLLCIAAYLCLDFGKYTWIKVPLTLQVIMLLGKLFTRCRGNSECVSFYSAQHKMAPFQSLHDKER